MRTVFLVMTLVLTLGVGCASAQSAEEAAINEVIEGFIAAQGKCLISPLLAEGDTVSRMVSRTDPPS